MTFLMRWDHSYVCIQSVDINSGLAQEMSSLKQQVQTANEQISQLQEEVQALNQKSADLQAELAQAEQANDALNQQLEVVPDAAVADLPWLLFTSTWPLLVKTSLNTQ